MEIQYKVKRQQERIGNYLIEIECLEDLNETIDQVFHYLEKSGDSKALEDLCPYFGVVWPAARGLSEYLSKVPAEKIKGKRVLELGCGLAIPSTLMEKRGAQVTATDFHPLVPQFLKLNTELNGLKNLEYFQVNWEIENPDLSPYDWVIGSDVLYESRYAVSLAKTVASKVTPQGTVVIADPGRPYLQVFVDEMKKWGFHCETQILKVPHPPQFQEVFVLAFKRSAKK